MSMIFSELEKSVPKNIGSEIFILGIEGMNKKGRRALRRDDLINALLLK